MKKLDSLWQAIVDGVKLALRNPALLKVILRLAVEVFGYLERHDEK
jgi:hypothetical protein